MSKKKICLYVVVAIVVGPWILTALYYWCDFVFYQFFDRPYVYRPGY